MPHAAPFLFAGPNLVVQVRYYKLITANSQPLATDVLYQQAPTQHLSVGRSCGGNLLASHDGTNLTLFAEGVPAGKAVTFVLGQKTSRSAPSSCPSTSRTSG